VRGSVLGFAVHPVAFRNPFDRTSQPLHTVALIPARFQSTRFPGKPLADLAGRPMIEHVYRRTAAARSVDAVAVATDDPRIVAAVEAFGGVARLTAARHRSGTDRIAEVARDLACEVVVNVQGDEPLIDPDEIDRVVEPFAADASVLMTTLRTPLTAAADYQSPHVVKVVVDRDGDALYFSRAPIPSIGPAAFDAAQAGRAGRHSGVPTVAAPGPAEAGPHKGEVAAGGGPMYRHIGVYAYRRTFLLELTRLPPSPLELAESLEQLRALEHGFRIRTVETPNPSVGVDTPADLERVRRLLAVAARV